jgi:hypothetical protein
MAMTAGDKDITATYCLGLKNSKSLFLSYGKNKT